MCSYDPLWRDTPLYLSPLARSYISEMVIFLIHSPPCLSRQWADAYKLNILGFLRVYILIRGMRTFSFVTTQGGQVVSSIAKITTGAKMYADYHPAVFLNLVGFSGWMLLAVSMMIAEGITFEDALWMTFITGTTVGYGDMVAYSWVGKVARVAAFMHRAERHRQLERLAAAIMVQGARQMIARRNNRSSVVLMWYTLRLRRTCGEFRAARRNFDRMVASVHAADQHHPHTTHVVWGGQERNLEHRIETARLDGGGAAAMARRRSGSTEGGLPRWPSASDPVQLEGLLGGSVRRTVTSTKEQPRTVTISQTESPKRSKRGGADSPRGGASGHAFSGSPSSRDLRLKGDDAILRRVLVLQNCVDHVAAELRLLRDDVEDTMSRRRRGSARGRAPHRHGRGGRRLPPQQQQGDNGPSPYGSPTPPNPPHPPPDCSMAASQRGRGALKFFGKYSEEPLGD
eukprot:gene21971-60604_t